MKLKKIIKRNGQSEPYSQTKHIRSLTRSGLSHSKCKEIAQDIINNLGPLTTSKDIFNKSYSKVSRVSPIAGMQYSLKKAIFELGPSGYTFEKYVARYFEEKGFKTKHSVVVQGEFVDHEVDVIAIKGSEKYFAECKFHNKRGIKNDIKISLYVKARWDDLKNGPGGKNLTGFFLVSNTVFTKDSLKYAKGTGLHLLGVNSPDQESFLDQIRHMKLWPVTGLKNLKKSFYRPLFELDVILIKDILKKPSSLSSVGINELEVSKILEEAKQFEV